MFVFPDRSKSLLSGAEIINFKQNSLKDIPAGGKDYAPDGSWLEQKQIQAALETHHSLISAQRIEKRSNLSTAEWLFNIGKAKVTKKAGKHWEVFGHTINSEDWLLPEEALFLLETNALELYLDEVPLSIEQTYALIIDDCISLSEYRVYSHLSRKGFRVLRHDKEISVTPYEKDIHADQVSLAAKRSIPGAPSKSERMITVDSNKDKLVVPGDISIDKPSSKNVVSDANSCAKASVSSSDAVGVIASTSSKDNVASASKDHETLASSNGTPGPVTIASSIVTDGADYTESTHKDLNSGTDAIQSSTGKSSPKNALSVPESSTGVDSKPDSSSKSKPESEVQNLVANGNALISKIQELISLESGDDSASDSNVIIEMPDENGEPSKAQNQNLEESMNIDDSSSEDAFPHAPSSPELVIVEAEDQVIEIDDDELSSEDEIMIMDVREPNTGMDTVNLLDSDEDDDVVYVCQKPTNSDPSKWRKWFLSTTQFVNFEYQDTPEDSTKTPKVKLIDLFDLGQKSLDSIWKAIPSHDSSDEFINSPDQRFIPSTVLPKFAQYRISLHHGGLTPRSESPGNVDTTRNLNEIVQYGREPFYFNRNDGYSFHRSRNYNRNAPWFTSNAARPPRNQMFGESQQNFRFNIGYQGNSFHSLPQTDDRNQQQMSSSNQNDNRNRFGNHHRSFGNFGKEHPQTNDRNPPQPHTSNGNQNYNRNRFGHYNQHRNFGNFDNQSSVRRPSNFQPQGNFAPNQSRNFHNQFGGNEGLKVAVMQACQMQMLAMGLMQSCQALMQQVPGFINPLNNMNMNMFPINNLVGGNLVQQPQQPYQYRGHRPYRRQWRGGSGRRRYYNDDRSEGPKITEIPITPNRDNREKENSDVVLVYSDDEDKKVKPAIKRNIALDAIASLNKPKKAKLKISTDVKSIKLDTSEPSTSSIIDLDDLSSVKSESPRESPRLQDVSKPSKKRLADVSPLARAVTPAGTPGRTSGTAEMPVLSEVSAHVPPKESIPAHPKKSIGVHPDENPTVDISDDSRPSYIVYDEQVSVDSDSVGFVSESPEAAVLNVDSCSRPEPMDVANSPDAVPDPGTLEETDSRPNPPKSAEDSPGSWKTYKEQEQSLGEDQPKRSGALVSMDNERSDIKDVMKSLRVIGPIDDTEAPRDELRVSYDVYLPNQPFRKSVRLLPNYRVIVAKSQCFPTILELNYLESIYADKVPFLYAVVTLDAIRLYNLRCVSLPTVVPDV